MKRHMGFGLLEAIVALALLTGLGLTVFSWINSNLSAVSRLLLYGEEARLRSLAAEWARTLNPAEHEHGETAFDDRTRIRWESRPLSPMTPAAPFPGGESTPFQLARYEVRLIVNRDGLSRPVQVEMTLVGYQREAVVERLDVP